MFCFILSFVKKQSVLLFHRFHIHLKVGFFGRKNTIEKNNFNYVQFRNGDPNKIFDNS